jgi:hypothetical protein
VCKQAHALGKSSLWLQRESELRETQLCVFGDNDKSRRTSASIRHGYIIDPLTALLIISKEKLYCIVLYCIVLYCIVLYCIVRCDFLLLSSWSSFGQAPVFCIAKCHSNLALVQA